MKTGQPVNRQSQGAELGSRVLCQQEAARSGCCRIGRGSDEEAGSY